jgi:hypothetical protein
MSRHCIATEPFEIVVGWDTPLQTFFLEFFEVAKDNDEEDKILLWLGTQPGELPTVADLESALASDALTSHVELTPKLRQQLEADKTKSTEPTVLQQWVIKIFTQSKPE